MLHLRILSFSSEISTLLDGGGVVSFIEAWSCGNEAANSLKLYVTCWRARECGIPYFTLSGMHHFGLSTAQRLLRFTVVVLMGIV